MTSTADFHDWFTGQFKIDQSRDYIGDIPGWGSKGYFIPAAETWASWCAYAEAHAIPPGTPRLLGPKLRACGAHPAKKWYRGKPIAVWYRLRRLDDSWGVGSA